MQVSRRQFTTTLAAVGLAAAPRVRLGAQAGVSPDEARAIYRRSISIDALANPGSMNVPWPPRGPLTPVQIDSIGKSGLTALNVTVSADDFESTVRNLALWTGEAVRYPRLISIVRRHEDIDRAKGDGTLGLILGFQNTEMLDRDLSRLELFHQLGVRIIQLTYNDRNIIGDGCLEPGDAGLSAFGRDAVARMNALGVAVDLSHCGTRTTADAVATSTRPPLITHSGCREVYRHPRSKEDRELKAMADKGGVVGIYFMPFIGGAKGEGATEELLARQIEHALKVCGPDHVGIGSDLSVTPIDETPQYKQAHRAFVEGRAKRGISAPDEERPLYIPTLNHPRRLEGVAELLARRGHAAPVIEKVIGGNFYRVLRDIWSVRS
ncbi:MAG: membrane dipeptidase [Acidobacteria bacterium]|nr:membrane dipeptidase [Acidobacteriota bacterium]MBI3264180.1 membrane dipeptidase [Acidobacteriota bacterium]